MGRFIPSSETVPFFVRNYREGSIGSYLKVKAHGVGYSPAPKAGGVGGGGGDPPPRWREGWRGVGWRWRGKGYLLREHVKEPRVAPGARQWTDVSAQSLPEKERQTAEWETWSCFSRLDKRNFFAQLSGNRCKREGSGDSLREFAHFTLHKSVMTLNTLNSC